MSDHTTVCRSRGTFGGRMAAPCAVLCALIMRADVALADSTPDAQPSRAWTLGPRLGAGFSQTRDETLSPLTYRGAQIVVGLVFAHDLEVDRHQARLELAPGYKVDRFGYRAIFLTQRFDYAYLRTVHDGSGLRVAIGPGAGIELDPAI